MSTPSFVKWDEKGSCMKTCVRLCAYPERNLHVIHKILLIVKNVSIESCRKNETSFVCPYTLSGTGRSIVGNNIVNVWELLRLYVHLLTCYTRFCLYCFKFRTYIVFNSVGIILSSDNYWSVNLGVHESLFWHTKDFLQGPCAKRTRKILKLNRS